MPRSGKEMNEKVVQAGTSTCVMRPAQSNIHWTGYSLHLDSQLVIALSLYTKRPAEGIKTDRRV